VYGGSGHSFKDIYVVNSLGDGINLKGAVTDVLLDGVQVSGFTKSGVTVEAANRIRITNCVATSSDGAAYPGDGFTLAPTGAGSNLITSLIIDSCRSRSNVGRGFAAVGFGSKNVLNATINACIAESNTSHGFHLLTAAQIMISECLAVSCGGDGYRLEGDVQYSRVLHSVADTNTGFGCREIVSGSTPNWNDLVGMVAVSNVGSNTITKVGANSLIPY
jgi:hypothetical protein